LLLPWGRILKIYQCPTDKSFVQVDIDPLETRKNQQTIALWGTGSLVLPKLLPLLDEREEAAYSKRLAVNKKRMDLQRDAEAEQQRHAR